MSSAEISGCRCDIPNKVEDPRYINSARAAVAASREPLGVEAQGVLWMSLRYALGRATYAVGDVCDAIAVHAHRLPASQRERMAREIEAAIERGGAGRDCDVQRWGEALIHLRATSSEPTTPGGTE